MKKRRDIKERFWEKVHKSSPDECWIWQGLSWHGYPLFSIDRKTSIRAHRFAWMITYGEIPKSGMAHYV